MFATLRGTPALLLCACLLASCGSSKKPIVVGSKDETEQMILGEIVAQHVEHRLGRTVVRRTGLGATATVYQAILSGNIGVYPEYTGLIETEILKEPADKNPEIVLARVQGQMKRIATIEVLDSLGFNNPSAMVVAAQGAEKIATLTDAARVETRWKLGMTYEFQSRGDALQALAPYRLPMGSSRVMDPKQLFAALEKGDVNMIATRATDGHLLSPDWKVLTDDQKMFPSYEACLMVRQDLVMAEPMLRPALVELSGKFNLETMRKLNAQVDIEHRAVAAVAADFLAQAGLR
jgi:glycine betaine/choline ABC-type transport system substrate-binding protein